MLQDLAPRLHLVTSVPPRDRGRPPGLDVLRRSLSYVRSFSLPDRYLWITLDRSV